MHDVTLLFVSAFFVFVFLLVLQELREAQTRKTNDLKMINSILSELLASGLSNEIIAGNYKNLNLPHIYSVVQWNKYCGESILQGWVSSPLNRAYGIITLVNQSSILILNKETPHKGIPEFNKTANEGVAGYVQTALRALDDLLAQTASRNVWIDAYCSIVGIEKIKKLKQPTLEAFHKGQ